MEWFTLVSTTVGVVLGIGATNVNERIKWKRDRRKALYESRSKLYAEYLASLTKTRDLIRIVARGVYPPGATRSEAADAAFASHSIYAGRYQIRITAPGDVAEAAAQALRGLRDIRSTVGQGHAHHSDNYNQAKAGYEAALNHLMDVMETDLQMIR
jgi:hypothetical protein